MNILFTVLNWGLGHAVRSIPIIAHLQKQGHQVTIASDGMVIDFLKKEFPDLSFETLPAYNIQYKFKFMPFNILAKGPKILSVLIQEHQQVQKIIRDEQIDLLINDNRLACYSKRVPSIFITHQLDVPVPNPILRTWTNRWHHFFINKHDRCWIPDVEGTNNLAGDISRSKLKTPPLDYIGPLSTIKIDPNKADLPLLVVLSGPEPQRTYLEEKIVKQSVHLPIQTILVRGTNQAHDYHNIPAHLSILDLVDRKTLAGLIERAQTMICRSGYTSLLDFSLNPKRLYFIPTPGQWEQEYLAEHWKSQMGIPFTTQKDFDLKKAYEDAKNLQLEMSQQRFESIIDQVINDIKHPAI